MDAETRHELKTNELAQVIDRIRNFDDERMRYVLIALTIILLAVVGYRWWSWSSRSALEGDWKHLAQIEQNLAAAKASG